MNKFTNKGFTLFEVLVVLSVMAVISLIAAPNYLKTKTESDIITMKNDVKTVETAANIYKTKNKIFPAHGLVFKSDIISIANNDHLIDINGKVEEEMINEDKYYLINLDKVKDYGKLNITGNFIISETGKAYLVIDEEFDYDYEPIEIGDDDGFIFDITTGTILEYVGNEPVNIVDYLTRNDVQYEVLDITDTAVKQIIAVNLDRSYETITEYEYNFISFFGLLELMGVYPRSMEDAWSMYDAYLTRGYLAEEEALDYFNDALVDYALERETTVEPLIYDIKLWLLGLSSGEEPEFEIPEGTPIVDTNGEWSKKFTNTIYDGTVLFAFAYNNNLVDVRFGPSGNKITANVHINGSYHGKLGGSFNNGGTYQIKYRVVENTEDFRFQIKIGNTVIPNPTISKALLPYREINTTNPGFYFDTAFDSFLYELTLTRTIIGLDEIYALLNQ